MLILNSKLGCLVDVATGAWVILAEEEIWEMSKLANMFSILHLDGEDDGEDVREEVTKTSSTSIEETASGKPGWYSFSSRMELQVVDYTR